MLLPKRLIPLNVSTCQREPEKNSGINATRTQASQILAERSTNWATKPHVGGDEFLGSEKIVNWLGLKL